MTPVISLTTVLSGMDFQGNRDRCVVSGGCRVLEQNWDSRVTSVYSYQLVWVEISEAPSIDTLNIYIHSAQSKHPCAPLGNIISTRQRSSEGQGLFSPRRVSSSVPMCVCVCVCVRHCVTGHSVSMFSKGIQNGLFSVGRVGGERTEGEMEKHVVVEQIKAHISGPWW